jgi:diguanylate cyclase (GGDEF)-like protein
MSNESTDSFNWLRFDDTLTGCYSCRYIDTLVEALLVDARRRQTPLFISLIDVDGFKRLNEVFGHAAGDSTLKEIGRVLKFTYSADGSIGRFGGDEFVVCR